MKSRMARVSDSNVLGIVAEAYIDGGFEWQESLEYAKEWLDSLKKEKKGDHYSLISEGYVLTVFNS